jgi:L-methionine (R)-S-oxide reductase
VEETEHRIREVASSNVPREDKARSVAREIKVARRYRWVGLYDVGESEICVVGWDGPGAPVHPRFPSDRGLCGAAAASARTVIADDVAADPRYLTTFGTTRSEMVVPVLDSGAVVGLIDIESDRLAAFSRRDESDVKRWGAAALAIWRGSGVSGAAFGAI